jgi:cytochrome c peroxidase
MFGAVVPRMLRVGGCSVAVLCVFTTGCLADVDILGGDDEVGSSNASFGSKNSTGFADTFFASGSNDTSNPFFASLGTNGRTCNSCHVQGEGWSITPAGVKARFDATQGNDPIFRLNDGSVSPTANVSTLAARQSAYALLLSKGLIRVGIGIPSNADFTLQSVDDPYGFASAAELSLFRRPLPTTNMPFLATVMWDGRETLSASDMTSNFAHQAMDATLGHAQATSTNSAQMNSIVTFETALFNAQTVDNGAGPLNTNGAKGGPQNLANVPFSIGINDTLSPGFNKNAMTLYDAWAPPTTQSTDAGAQKRYSIFRGQQIFNTKTIAISGVAGLNDLLGVATINGTCTTCHNTPNVGNHSSSLPINIGIGSVGRRTSDMPLYTFRRKSDGATIAVTDPGRALITGKYADIGKFKGPILRGLQQRPPFFHDGSAATLQDVINFYNTRFSIGLSTQEQKDLLAFLQAL